MRPEDQFRLAQESRQAAQALAEAFRRGVQPQAVDVRMALQPGEYCTGYVPVTVLQYLAADTSWTKKGGGYVIGGSPAGLVFGGAYSALKFGSNVVGNQLRKAKAAREAAAQWRPVEGGTVYITSERFAVQGQTQWFDIWYGDVRVSDCTELGLQLELSNQPPTVLQVPAPEYWFVMFNKLAYDKVVDTPAPGASPA
jgi:hypothetical protein